MKSKLYLVSNNWHFGRSLYQSIDYFGYYYYRLIGRKLNYYFNTFNLRSDVCVKTKVTTSTNTLMHF